MQQLTGKGPTFRERHWRVVAFLECGVEVAAGSLLTHHLSQNGVGGGDSPHSSSREAQTFRVFFQKQLSRLWCPVAGCLGGAYSRTNPRIHFAHRHIPGTVVILEEDICPYTRCHQCDTFVPQKALNCRHLAIEF